MEQRVKAPFRVFIVEDSPMLRTRVQAMVASIPGAQVIGHAEDAESATRAILADAPDVVVLDLQLAKGHGLDVLRALRKDGDKTPVIVLTARGEVDQRVLGLQIGADDYVVKPFSVHELDARMQAVQRRAAQPAARIRLGAAEIDLAGHAVHRAGAEHRLLPKEAELLAWLLRHRGQTCSRDDLLRAVWGYDATPTTRTVDTHVFQLRQKIEADPARPEFLLTVHGVGYRVRE